MGVVIVPAILLGLITSLHCVGMCGPIALSLGIEAQNKAKFVFKNLIYQFGRITTYSFLGILLGFFGKGISLVGYQKYLTIFIGILLVISAFVPSVLKSLDKGFFSKILNRVRLGLSKLLGKKSYSSLYSIGLLNGFLPCGPVYTALTASLAFGSLTHSGLFMLFFGLGTLPLMFLVVFMGNMIGQQFRKFLLKIYPFLVFILGVLFILRGLGLGIPYVSPPDQSLEIEATQSCH